jgi:hypothetical protein
MATDDLQRAPFGRLSDNEWAELEPCLKDQTVHRPSDGEAVRILRPDGRVNWTGLLGVACEIGWTPSEFWGSSLHDFTVAVEAYERMGRLRLRSPMSLGPERIPGEVALAIGRWALLERRQAAKPLAPMKVTTTTPEPRAAPQTEAARRAIAERFPDGVPDQAVLPNKSFCAAVREGLRGEISDRTILRAAGRAR